MEEERKENQGLSNLCDACGEPLTVRCSIGAYHFCRKCSSAICREEALQIAKMRHKEKLVSILKNIEP
jgi:hypothetical protein